MASLLAAPSFSPQLRIFQGLRTKAIKTLDSVQVPAIRCSLNSNQTLKTCKICKTQFDPLLNHPRACRFHTAHFGGTPFLLLLLHCLFAEKNWRKHNQIRCSFFFFFFEHSFFCSLVFSAANLSVRVMYVHKTQIWILFLQLQI